MHSRSRLVFALPFVVLTGVPRPADGPDYSAKATANANAVLDAMHDDLRHAAPGDQSL